MDEKWSVVNLGSYAPFYDFNYSEYEIPCKNLSLKSQFLLADFEILKSFSIRLKENATVILGLSLFSFMDGYDITYFDPRYYTFLPSSSIWNYDLYRSRKVLAIQKNPVNYFPLFELKSEMFHIFSKKKSIPLSMMALNANKWIKDWSLEFSISNINAPLSDVNNKLAQQAVIILYKIKDYCDSNNLKMVIVLPPVTTFLRNLLSQDFLNNYIYNFLNAPLLKTIPFYNYLDTAFIGDHLFRDAYAMNSEGAKMFTKRVLSDLEII